MSVTGQQLRSYMPQTYNHSLPAHMYGAGMPGMQHFHDSTANSVKGKGKEIDFESAFAQFAESMPSQGQQLAHIEEVGDDMTELEQRLNNTSLNAEAGQKSAEGDLERYCCVPAIFIRHSLFSLRLWESLRNFGPTDDVAKWEAEFAGLMNAERDALEDVGKDMQMAYENSLDPSDVLRYDDSGIPELGPYIFGEHLYLLFFALCLQVLVEKNNPHLSSMSQSLLTEARLLLERNGSLSEAALMLEAAIQQGELGEGGYETWVLLGETRNMDEREEAGMRALVEGVKKAELAGLANGMLVGVLFINQRCTLKQ